MKPCVLFAFVHRGSFPRLDGGGSDLLFPGGLTRGSSNFSQNWLLVSASFSVSCFIDFYCDLFFLLTWGLFFQIETGIIDRF